MSTGDVEKRKNTRVVFQAEAVVRGYGEDFSARADTRDISMQGLYLATDRRPPFNATGELEIKLTGTSSHLSIRVKARVVRHDSHGVGFVFEGVDFDSYFHLKNLLMYNATDPDVIKREAPL